jgi:hypothetical protein
MFKKNPESEIQKREENLIDAMRQNNLSFLENIFSEKYVFLGSDGSTWGKEKALDDYRNPRYKLSKIEIHNRKIIIHNCIAIVTGISAVEGIIGEETLTGRYLFMRVWYKSNKEWKIIAVNTCMVDSISGSRRIE